jgi:tetratricopeptide (TPR) repeat protein
MFTYLYAAYLFMVMEEENRPELKEEISQCLKKIPQLKRTVGGKKVFHEKIVIERSKKYCDQVENFLLPPLELCYLWNVFHMMSGKSENILPFMERVQAKLDFHINDKEIPNRCLDRYCYLMFMKGVCYRHMGYPLQATECFQDVLSCKKRIEDETHLLPQSSFELGVIHKQAGDLKEAKKWLKKARDEYSNYLTEIMIQYRANHLLKKIKQQQTLQKEQQMKQQTGPLTSDL